MSEKWLDEGEPLFNSHDLGINFLYQGRAKRETVYLLLQTFFSCRTFFDLSDEFSVQSDWLLV